MSNAIGSNRELNPLRRICHLGEVLLGQGRAIMFTRRAAFEKNLKNFEAEGHSDWKNKMKKVITTADVQFST